MVDDDDVLLYLEHFGVRGMKWGSRRTPEEKEQHKKAAKAVGFGLAVAVGAALAARYLKVNGKINLTTAIIPKRGAPKYVDVMKLMDMTKVLPRR